MRLRFSILCAAVIAVLMCGCRVQNSIPDKTTAGNGYDVVVLCDDALWTGDVSTAVSDVLELEAPGLTRPQGYFSIVKHVAPNMATDVDKKYPNLLALSVNPPSWSHHIASHEMSMHDHRPSLMSQRQITRLWQHTLWL